MEKEIGSFKQIFVYRNPIRNHDAMMQVQQEFRDISSQHGDTPGYEVFQLDKFGTEVEGITNIANTVSAKEDEEVWIEILSYRDRKQMEEQMEMCKKDERMGEVWQKFIKLVTPGTGLIVGNLRGVKH